jgi:hypothetical protein
MTQDLAATYKRLATEATTIFDQHPDLAEAARNRGSNITAPDDPTGMPAYRWAVNVQTVISQNRPDGHPQMAFAAAARDLAYAIKAAGQRKPADVVADLLGFVHQHLDRYQQTSRSAS